MQKCPAAGIIAGSLVRRIGKTMTRFAAAWKADTREFHRGMTWTAKRFPGHCAIPINRPVAGVAPGPQMQPTARGRVTSADVAMDAEPRIGTPEREEWQRDKNRRASAILDAINAKAKANDGKPKPVA